VRYARLVRFRRGSSTSTPCGAIPQIPPAFAAGFDLDDHMHGSDAGYRSLVDSIDPRAVRLTALVLAMELEEYSRRAADSGPPSGTLIAC
jgi:hypothetical protein